MILLFSPATSGPTTNLTKITLLVLLFSLLHFILITHDQSSGFFLVMARTDGSVSIAEISFSSFFFYAFLCIIIRANISQEVYEGTALFSV